MTQDGWLMIHTNPVGKAYHAWDLLRSNIYM